MTVEDHDGPDRIADRVEDATARADDALRRLPWTGPEADETRRRVRRHRARAADLARRLRHAVGGGPFGGPFGPADGGPR